MPNFNYELQKLLSIRSTYVMSVIAIVFTVLIVAITILNFKGLPGEVGSTALAQIIFDSPIVATILGPIVAILIIGHEYRYNTIAYTLTASRSRTKVLLSKSAVVFLYGIAIAVLSICAGVVTFYIGVSLKDIDVPVQHFSLWSVVLRSVLTCVGNVFLGLVIALLVRNIVLAIAGIFILPTIEQILSLWLKDNAAYLPSIALSQLNYLPGQSGATFSPLKGGLIFLAYIVIAWLIAWILFLRRDAS